MGKQNDINLRRALISGTFGLIVFILVALLYRGETNTYNARSSYSLDNAAARESYKMLQLKSINAVLNDPSYSLYCAMNLAENGFINEGVEVITKLHINDPRNQDAINALALINESINKISDAIEYRLKIAKLDPWNSVNYLQLGKDYKAQGDLIKSKEILDKILSFSTGAVGGPIAEQAKKELS